MQATPKKEGIFIDYFRFWMLGRLSNYQTIYLQHKHLFLATKPHFEAYIRLKTVFF